MKHSNIAFFIPHMGCSHQCSFCNQRVIAGQEEVPSPQEIAKICAKTCAQMGEQERLDTEIAFFGGSFTALPDATMRLYLDHVFPFVNEKKAAGIRVSTRPDAISDPVLALLKEKGVTSIELGAQSMDDAVLGQNKRGHSAKDVVVASEKIRSHGFSLGLQMMVGLLGDSQDTVLYTAKALAACHPETMRIYPTVVLPGTYLEQCYLQGDYQPWGLEKTVHLCAQLLDFFENQSIRVIRNGLHADDFFVKNMLAGPYHPAFGELCENQRFLNRACRQIENLDCSCLQILVHPRSLSKMIGQKRRNVKYLQEHGFRVKISTDESLSQSSVVVKGILER